MSTFALTGLSLFIYMCVGSLIATAKKRRDIADIMWGLGFVLVAWVSFYLNPYSLFGLTINALITAWGLRLSLHIYLKNRHRPEDFRYDNMGTFKTFMVQGLILYLIALPIFWIHTHPKETSWNLFLFIIPFWASGFLLEAISDYQLLCFQKKPSHKGKLLTTGFWGYSRHPNYLGEITQWWSIWALGLSIPLGWVFVVSPLLLTFLIIKVSGIAPLEKRLKNYPGFDAYIKKTPLLVPPQFINGSLYALTCMVLIPYGYKMPVIDSLGIFTLSYLTQVCLFWLWDKKSLYLCVPLSICAALIGLIQETAFIHFKVISYPEHSSFPPLWVFVLYPLFSLLINSSCAFLNRNLIFTFFFGGSAALISYLSGAKVGAAHIFNFYSNLIIFIFWGLFMVLMVLLNRRFVHRYESKH